MFSGVLEHSHAVAEVHAHGDHFHVHHHAHDAGNMLFNERWLNLLFAGVSLLTFFLIASVDDHFLTAHLWGHVIKKHFFKIFGWTLGALAALQLLFLCVDVHQWISGNMWLVLLIAVTVGLIPESGPHMIFVSLYAAGAIPFSILLANCIVQDGHTALPLLAESPRAFVCVKALKFSIGLAVGCGGYFFGI
jgi:hypothetical protein